jgi:spore maturation protein CgeB
MGLRVLIVGTFYDGFLNEMYRARPGLESQPSETQLRALLESGFGAGDAVSSGLRAAGCDARDVICNADAAQSRWAVENGIALPSDRRERRRAVVAAQVQSFRPDVLLVPEWNPLGDAFLKDLKPRVRLIVGEIASSLRPDRTYAAYDLVISSWPPIVEYFRGTGKRAEFLPLAFDERILNRLGSVSRDLDVTFVGGLSPVHDNRLRWLEEVVGQVPVTVFGYGAETLPPDSSIRRVHRGPVWGLDMYRVLARSRITLNAHGSIDVRGRVSREFANNMRLFEATGVGTLLLTDHKSNLHELFEPDREVVSWRTPADGVEKIRDFLNRDADRDRIARAGQQRTLREHTYTARTRRLAEILRESL